MKFISLLIIIIFLSGCVGVNSCSSYNYRGKKLEECLNYQVEYLNKKIVKRGFILKVVPLKDFSSNKSDDISYCPPLDKSLQKDYSKSKEINHLQTLYKNIKNSCEELKNLRIKIITKKEREELEERIFKCEKEREEILNSLKLKKNIENFGTD